MLMLQSLSNTKLPEELFIIYLIAILCKESLNALPIKSTSQNNINKINLVY